MTYKLETICRQKILEMNDVDIHFLYELNRILLNYDYCKNDDEKLIIIEASGDHFDLHAEREFFDEKMRPFLENIKSVSDFCTRNLDVANQNLSQKRALNR